MNDPEAAAISRPPRGQSSGESQPPRESLLRALNYPRRVMQQYVSLDLCPHAGHYAHRDTVCTSCDTEIECTWLAAHDEQVGLDQKPLSALVDALETAHAYVDAQVTRLGHNRSHCRCESCHWLREADRLLDQARL